MNGINILETIELVTRPYEMTGLMISFVVTLFVFAALGIIIGKNDIAKENGEEKPFVISKKMWIVGIIAFVFFNVACFFVSIYSEPTGEHEYICTLDNTVTVNEFLEHYEILEIETNKNGVTKYRIKEK